MITTLIDIKGPIRTRLQFNVEEGKYIKKYFNEMPRSVMVYLEREGQPTAIHCIYCKNTLMECQHNVAQIIPGSAPLELNHLKIKCQNDHCNTMYYFVSTI